MHILVINGPNLNMLGIREPALYGTGTYNDLVSYIGREADALGVTVDVFQSNHEGAIVDRIQRALTDADAIVINAAGYTHTSVAILDALKAVALPAVEVHLTEPNEREPLRRVSYVGMACEKRFAGMGFAGYAEAMRYLVNG